jgi:hypothetical protein
VLRARTHNGRISIHTAIPAPGDAESYVVTIGVTPQPAQDSSAQHAALDALYGALADTPLPEITEDPAPEQRHALCCDTLV